MRAARERASSWKARVSLLLSIMRMLNRAGCLFYQAAPATTSAPPCPLRLSLQGSCFEYPYGSEQGFLAGVQSAGRASALSGFSYPQLLAYGAPQIISAIGQFATESSRLAVGARSGVFRVWGRVSVGVALCAGGPHEPERALLGVFGARKRKSCE
jgi:hypothetical protein